MVMVQLGRYQLDLATSHSPARRMVNFTATSICIRSKTPLAISQASVSFRASHSLGITTILQAKIWRRFPSLTLQWGGTPTIFDPIANSFSAKTFTWANTPGHGNYFTCTAHGYNQGVAVRLTTTGTLPTGGSPALATGTTYWVIPVDANTLLINPYPLTATAGDYTIYPTGAGSGTNTMTPYNYVCHFGSAWVATTSGRYVYVQGGGSIASDPTLQIQYDIPYELATKTLPPWDQTIGTVSSMAATNWAPQAVWIICSPTLAQRAIGQISDFSINGKRRISTPKQSKTK